MNLLNDEFNLKVINIKRNLVLKIENLKDKITSIRKDIESTSDKNLTETINHEGENEKLNDKIKLFETENKILKNDKAIKQKLIDSLLQHNSLLLTQQERLTAELLTPTSENSCISRKKDVVQTENKFGQEEIPAKSGISKANKLPMKKKSVKSNITNRNQKSLFTIKNRGESNRKQKTRTDSPNTNITAKQNVTNTATQNTQNSNEKTESDTPDKGKLPVTVIFCDSMVKDIKVGKCQAVLSKLS